MNVFQYSAAVQQAFSSSFENYESFTTYAGDFAIADWYSVDSVKETATNAWKYWSSNYKWATEIIMVLNWMSWFHFNNKNETLCKLYSELYYEYRDKFYELYNGNEEATQYFFDMTD